MKGEDLVLIVTCQRNRIWLCTEFGAVTLESCPLNNADSRKVVLSAPPDLESVAKKYKINKILGT